MSLCSLEADIIKARNQSPGTRWYGFGSFFRGQPVFCDIDLLVVCREQEDAVLVRKLTAECCARWPIHLIVMTESEEAETDFVATAQALDLDQWKMGGVSLVQPITNESGELDQYRI